MPRDAETRDAALSREQTFWNGEPTPARKVRGVVADAPFPAYWARRFIGQERNAVEVVYSGETFYLDDENYDGSGDEPGWRKVTVGHGSPHYRHRNLSLEGVVERG